MGGIIGLYYKNHYPHSIQNFISIGSPYYGTKMAPLLSFIPAAHQVRRNSDFLSTLHKKTSNIHSITSIRAIFDEIVIPSNSAHLGGTKDIIIPEIGHMNLLFSKKTFEAVKKILET
jgi:triacylglycerol lipase